jgi:hypothetical protein
MYLGIEQDRSLIYEGLGAPELPAIPRPVITQAKLIKSDSDWDDLPVGLAQSPFTPVFREDSFDAMTRTRRGRLYQPEDGQQPSWRPVAPHPLEDPMMRAVGAGGRVTKTLYTYRPYTELLAMPNHGQGALIVLGGKQAASAWRIVQSEILVSSDVMVTLKALSAFGIVPEIDIGKVQGDQQVSVTQALSRVLESAFRETPISVVDHCRNAATVIVSRWLVQNGAPAAVLSQDLGQLTREIGGSPHDKLCVQRLCEVIARLHVRGKANEQVARSLRIPVDEDAELALQALGFIVREFGWAKY